MEGDDDDSDGLPRLLEDVEVSTLYRHTLCTEVSTLYRHTLCTCQPAAAFIRGQRLFHSIVRHLFTEIRYE